MQELFTCRRFNKDVEHASGTYCLVFSTISDQIYYEFRAYVLYNIKNMNMKKINYLELYDEKWN